MIAIVLVYSFEIVSFFEKRELQILVLANRLTDKNRLTAKIKLLSVSNGSDRFAFYLIRIWHGSWCCDLLIFLVLLRACC